MGLDGRVTGGIVGGGGVVNGSIIGTCLSIASGDYVVTFVQIGGLPTQNRWRGLVDSEMMLFEGTSGGRTVNVVLRGIDGTVQTAHGATSVYMKTPSTVYGVNLVETEKMGFMYPQEWTSGGMMAARMVPQTQTVTALDGSGFIASDGITYYSGVVNVYDYLAAKGAQFPQKEYVWVLERNSNPVNSGILYDGQLLGTTKTIQNTTPFTAPLYGVNEYPSIPLSPTTSGNVVNVSGGSILYNSGYYPTYTSGPTFIFTSGTYIRTDGPMEICGYLFWCCTTYTPYSASLSNWVQPVPGKIVIDFDTTTLGVDITLNSIVPANFLLATGPQVLAFVNTGTNKLRFTNKDGSGNNQIFLPPVNGSSVALSQNDTIVLWYDTCKDLAWKVLSCTVQIGSSASFSGARAYLSLNLTVPAVTDTVMTYDINVYDTAAYHSLGSSKFVAPVTGYYEIGGTAYCVPSTMASPSPYVSTYLKLNGTSIIVDESFVNGGGTNTATPFQANVSCQYRLTAGDYVEMYVLVGGSTGFTATGGLSAVGNVSMWMALLGS